MERKRIYAREDSIIRQPTSREPRLVGSEVELRKEMQKFLLQLPRNLRAAYKAHYDSKDNRKKECWQTAVNVSETLIEEADELAKKFIQEHLM